VTLGRRGLVGSCALALVLACAPAVHAQGGVRMRTNAAGVLEITNDGGGFRFRTHALVLRPVPRADWNEVMLDAAVANGVDPKLVQAIMQVESAYNPRAVSRAGARGLMQLMPDTARLVQVADVFSPAENIRGGVLYLRQMIDKFGRLEYAVAAYNAGPGAVARHGGIPPYTETRDYVDRVLALYRGTGAGLLTGLISFGGSGAPARPNGLMQANVPTMLQRALAGHAITPAAPPPQVAAPPPAAAPSAPAGTQLAAAGGRKIAS